ncbi:MAG: hypothetical protein JWN30_51, partial [Bacilli bacterium]|nr:hypothetical protein [Bacilli bacterium]
LKWKLISIFSAIVLCNLVVVGYFVNGQVSREIQKDDINLSSLVLQQVNLNLARYLNDYENFIYTLGTSDALGAWTDLSNAGNRAESVVPFYMIQTDYIKPFLLSHPELLSVMLYISERNQAYFSPVYGIQTGYSMSKEPWLTKVSVVANINYFSGVSSMYVDPHNLRPVNLNPITMVKRFGINGSTFVKVDFQPTLLQNILDKINIGNNGVGLIVNSEGTIVAHSQQDSVQSQLDPSIFSRIQGTQRGSFVLPTSGEIVIYQSIGNTNWKSVILIPFEEIAGSIYSIRNFMILFAAFCLLVSAFLIFMISSSITRRITKLREIMKYTGQGQIDLPVPVEGEDEISILADAYNRMLDDLRQNIRRSADAKLAEEQAVLLSLQSQIDSHFLYNTLEIINSMATQIEHQEIEQITISLSHMFRYTANYHQTEVTIREEVQHLLSYLQIIKIRFEQLFTYVLHVEDSCWEAKCLKVILQPLAENAIKHGFERTGSPLHLLIEVRNLENQWIQVTIADNGKGFSEQELEQLNRQFQNNDMHYSDFRRIGLLNIQYRLNTRYAAMEAGINIENDNGAVVKLVFPFEN